MVWWTSNDSGFIHEMTSIPKHLTSRTNRITIWWNHEVLSPIAVTKKVASIYISNKSRLRKMTLASTKRTHISTLEQKVMTRARPARPSFFFFVLLVVLTGAAKPEARQLTSTLVCLLTGSVESVYYTVDIGLHTDFEINCSEQEMSEIGSVLDGVINDVNFPPELGILHISNNDICLVDPSTIVPEGGAVRR